MFQVDQVAAKGDFLILQSDPQAGGLQRGPSGVILQGVIAHEAQVGDIAPGFASRRNGLGPAHDPLSGQPIHKRSPGRLQRGFSVQLLQRIVPHAVSDQDHVFLLRLFHYVSIES